MPEDTTKRINVTFGTGPPLGTHARFKHAGEWWVAYPTTKNDRILSVIDRMIGIINGFEREMVRWINTEPGDAPRVARILEILSRARKVRGELVIEKTEARTM